MSKVVNFKRRYEPSCRVAPGPMFEAAWMAFPEIGKRRSSRRLCVLPWVSAAMEVGEQALVEAVKRYAREDHDAIDGFVPGFHRWLEQGRWEYWIIG